MKRIALVIGPLLILVLTGAACTPTERIGVQNEWRMPRHEGVALTYRPIPKTAYARTESGTMLAHVPAFDEAGWLVSRMMAEPLRGQRAVRIGCTSCPEGRPDCDYVDSGGGCTKMSYSFDFSVIQPDAEIVSARLAVLILDNHDLVDQTVLTGRFNVGSEFQVVSPEPQLMGSWALYDITPFACQAVAQRRHSVGFQLSLPCGPEERVAVATMRTGWGRSFSAQHTRHPGMTQTEPRVIFEYR